VREREERKEGVNRTTGRKGSLKKVRSVAGLKGHYLGRVNVKLLLGVEKRGRTGKGSTGVGKGGL